ncbi:MAG: SGNH/GDSL hydrolase family protein [Clostridiales bacterium]|nr:SGNH/GDSL hydrolase family protein [Clostridiales bacterium]
MSTAISIWGDSIMRGVIFDPVKKRYTFLRDSAVELFSRRFSVPITNHSRFGCTATRAFSPLVKSLESDGASGLILLEFGGNDCDYDWKEVSRDPLKKHQSNTPIEKFEESMRGMIRAIRAAGSRPVTMSLPPIHAERYFDAISSLAEVIPSRIMEFLHDKQVIYRRQELYSSRVCRIAEEMDVPLVDVRTKFLELDRLDDYLCMDGIHPNEKGQALIQEEFASRYRKFEE